MDEQRGVREEGAETNQKASFEARRTDQGTKRQRDREREGERKKEEVYIRIEERLRVAEDGIQQALVQLASCSHREHHVSDMAEKHENQAGNAEADIDALEHGGGDARERARASGQPPCADTGRCYAREGEKQ